ncbi:hypothetical protein [Pseudoponticoccus marisrubri]|uniref:DUF3726 domain-containing protein n=1 Tax=Pseudoponticoccus marisrubri TaxID=1685382 RepID=A0A0W7WNR1_9RHOB|nr:hypothetical protein [Pseudoponticoccus marisrubri]KUF12198.1 hypothetical protein AVJ23_00220 [Pseudoponticoccus marisrubri]
MTRSASEIAALAREAARGAGFPPAQADSFGRAAVLHLARGGDEATLRAALADPADSPILRLPLLAEDILRALTLAGPQVEMTLHPGDAALAPAYIALLDIAIETLEIVPGSDGAQRLRVHADAERVAATALPARLAVSESLAAELGALADRTLVPASEQSRSAGAGAGDIDND